MRPDPRRTASLNDRMIEVSRLTPTRPAGGDAFCSFGAAVSTHGAPRRTTKPSNFCSAAGRSFEAVLPSHLVSPLSSSSCTCVPAFTGPGTSTTDSKLPPVALRSASRSFDSSMGALFGLPSQANRAKLRSTSGTAAPAGPATIR
ncbi:hypothetical protein D3C85_1101180 [compost metagenome]